MTVYDFDTGPSGDYIEELTVPEFAYYVTPLRPSSGDVVTSTVFVNEAQRTFTSTVAGSSADNPSSPTTLTNAQAANGVQFFFASDDGVIDAGAGGAEVASEGDGFSIAVGPVTVAA